MASGRGRKIEYIIYQKYSEHIRGLSELNRFILKSDSAEGLANLENEIDNYRKELEEKSFEELQALDSSPEGLIEQRKLTGIKRYLSLNDMLPRHKHWAAMAYWSVDEAIALTVGIEPRFMKDTSLPRDVKMFLAEKIHDVKEPIQREWPNGFIDPVRFLRWVKRYDIDFPQNLGNLIVGPEIEKPKEQLKEKLLGTRERETFLKLIIGMAIKKYRYDSKKLKNSAATNIMSDLDELNIPVGDDTIRNILSEAKEILPRE